MTVEWISKSLYYHGTVGLSTDLPPDWEPDDIVLLFMENAATETRTTPSGWTTVSGFPYATTSGGVNTKLYAYWRRMQSGDSAPSLADSGDSQSAIYHCFRGCPTSGDPFTASNAILDNNEDTTGLLPSITTTRPNSLLVYAITNGLDTDSGSVISGVSAGSGTTDTVVRSNDNTSFGNGGGVCVVTARKPDPGSSSGGSYTTSGNTKKVGGVIALSGTPSPIVEHESTPDPVVAKNTSLTTSSFTPPSASMLLVLTSQTQGPAGVPAMTDSDGGSSGWTFVAGDINDDSSNIGASCIQYKWIEESPGPITVNAVFPSANSNNIMAVRVLTGVHQTDPIAGTVTFDWNGSTTTFRDRYTPTEPGTEIYGSIQVSGTTDTSVSYYTDTVVIESRLDTGDDSFGVVFTTDDSPVSSYYETGVILDPSNDGGTKTLAEIRPSYGADYSRTLEDNAGLNDDPEVIHQEALEVNVSDNLTLDDNPISVASDYVVTASDILGLIDEPDIVEDPALDFTRTATDGGLDEQVTLLVDYVGIHEDTSGLSDTQTFANSFTRDFTDAADLSDAITRPASYVRDVSDDLSLEDESQVAANFVVPVEDTVELSDERYREQTLGQTDGLDLSDALSTALAMEHTYSDDAGLDEVFEETLFAASDQNELDSLDLSDSVSFELTFIESDDLGLSDAITVVQNHVMDVSDTLEISDELERATERLLSDSMDLDDDFNRVWEGQRVFTDYVGLDSMIEGAGQVSRAPVDNAGVEETVSITGSFVRTFSDDAGSTDETYRVFDRDLSDDTGLTDAQEYVWTLTVSDTVQLQDAVESDAIIPAIDTVGLSDDVYRTITRLVSDEIELADAHESVGSFIRDLTDGLGLSDAAEILADNALNLTDTLGPEDDVSMDRVIVFSDGVGLDDSPARTLTYTFSDSCDLSDETAVGLGQAESASDELGLSDTLYRVVGLGQSDTAGLSDTATVAHTVSLTFSDACGLDDVQAREMDAVRDFSDELLDDELYRVLTRDESDSLTLRDELLFDIVLVVDDTSTVGDTLFRTFERDLSDTEELYDSTQAPQVYVVEVSDTCELSDEVYRTHERDLSDDTGMDDDSERFREIVLELDDVQELGESLAYEWEILFRSDIEMESYLADQGTIRREIDRVRPFDLVSFDRGVVFQDGAGTYDTVLPFFTGDKTITISDTLILSDDPRVKQYHFGPVSVKWFMDEIDNKWKMADPELKWRWNVQN